MIGTPALWIGFTVGVLALLALDLGVINRRTHAIGAREAFGWSCFWIGLALGFNLFLYIRFGKQAGLEFLTGYLIEEALSVDNLFVFVVIFGYFSVPAQFQHRVLFWGILGALVMRAVFILAGTALLHQFHWLIYVFGGFLILTAIKILSQGESKMDPGRNPILRLFRRFVPMTDAYHGAHFFIREGGRRLATPMLAVLAVVEGTDVVFAIDSIPAVLGVTRDPFIVYSSNICAVLGLRTLYFLLASVIHKFHLLKYGLGLVLAFVGVKMVCSGWLFDVPIAVSLGVVGGLLGLSVVASLAFPPSRPAGKGPAGGSSGTP
ncbi:MAG: TerC family protein [Planctomycetes bacterium]|nr:TerC family protein [Planctomycetota bacterium]